MRIVRFNLPGKGPKLGVFISEENVVDLTSLVAGRINTVLDLLIEAKEQGSSPKAIVENIIGEAAQNNIYSYNDLSQAMDKDDSTAHLLLPIVPPEVWAAGVTYKRSVEARMEESQIRDVYERVYSAERPEIFFKATSARVVGYGEKIGTRSDSNSVVPEPELGVVIGLDHEIIGFIIGNDVTTRDIEGENPLYLPQAKIFKNSCSLGPVIAFNDTIINPYELTIDCKVYRDDIIIFHGSANTSQLNRKIEDLLEFLLRDNIILPGTVLLTGTCIVPPDTFCLKKNDLVVIEIDHLGKLINPVG